MTGVLSAAAAVAITSAAFWRVTEPARSLGSFLRSPDLRLVSLGGSDQQPAARGRVLWDRQTNRWQVAVFDLKPLPTGRTYELWYITPDQKKSPAGTFEVDARGNASMTVAIPTDVQTVALAAITDEPSGGAPQPTGQIQLVGKVP